MSKISIHNSQEEIVVTENDIRYLGIQQYAYDCQDEAELPYCRYTI